MNSFRWLLVLVLVVAAGIGLAARDVAGALFLILCALVVKP